MKLQGEKIYLQSITNSDKDYFYIIATKSDGAKFWYDKKQREARSKSAFFKDWHEGYFNIKKTKAGQCFWIMQDKKKVGVIAYNTIDAQNKKTEIDIIIGDATNMGKGYGSDAIKTLCGYIFDKFGLNKIWIEARANNPRAIQAYQNTGFKKEGILREEDYFNGEFVDCVRLGILKKEFQK